METDRAARINSPLTESQKKIMVDWLTARSEEEIDWRDNQEAMLKGMREDILGEINDGFNVPQEVKDYFAIKPT